jgi:hypothetical protein
MTSRTKLLILALSALAAALAACSGDDDDDAIDAGVDAGPEPICLEPGDGPYPLAFTDVTEELGLGPDALRITGNLAAIADVNGDHWPDLALSKGSTARETPEAPQGLYRLLLNNGDGSFTDATFTSGLFTARDGTGGRAGTYAVFADVDNDGDKDALGVVYEDTGNYADLLDGTSIYFNDGTGAFAIGPEQDFSPDVVNPMAGAAFLDYDHDGLLDLFAGHHYGNYGYLNTTIEDSVLRGDGAGGFTDVTEEVGAGTVDWSSSAAPEGNTHKPTWGVTACDLDGDGWDDLLTDSYGRQFNQTFRNVGGMFENLTMTSGFASDGNEDYGDNQFYLCFCEAHPDEPACEGAGDPSIYCDGLENSWTVGSDDQPWRLGGNNSNAACGDLDNDGDMDLLNTTIAHWHIGQSSDKTELLYNEGFPAAPFARPGNEATGLTRAHAPSWNEGDLGGLLADFDNDGRLDVFVASSDYPDTFSLLWQQQTDGTFEEIEEEAGALVHRSHGVAVIDFDRDGDYDIVSGTSLARWTATDDPPVPDDAYAYVLRNDLGAAANKLMLHVRGSGAAGGANRDALGARVTVTAGGVTYTREVQGPYGLDGIQNDELMIIGIGAACAADSVTVRWPNAALDEIMYENVLANYVVLIEEGQPLAYRTLAEYAPAP